ncbi:unnamed protein product [Cuscuta campestris]|uniref:Uncharacterized protein n=1 Tax=Cuscuta campestris TaxID=132261 RepID=A0A484KSX9_9ASTE|nr:unnamed protein product [Cuscuta campestris]
MMVLCVQGQGPVWMNRTTTTALSPSPIFRRFPTRPWKEGNRFNSGNKKARSVVLSKAFLFPVDPWAPTVDSQSIASQLFAVSLFPYMGFLYFITRSKTAPKLTLFGFYFLLAFVGATSAILIRGISLCFFKCFNYAMQSQQAFMQRWSMGLHFPMWTGCMEELSRCLP